MGPPDASRQIGAAEIVQHLQMLPMGNIIPANERQCRPLLAFSDSDPEDKRVRIIDMEQVGNVWAEVVERADKDKDGSPHITAKHVYELHWRGPTTTFSTPATVQQESGFWEPAKSYNEVCTGSTQ